MDLTLSSLPYSITIQYIDKFYNNNTDTGFYKSQLKINREVDRLIGGSKIGPHKSDFMCYVKDSIPANQLSTGQQKTLVLLLILAQCKHLVSDCKINPIILMFVNIEDSNNILFISDLLKPNFELSSAICT